MLDVILYFSLYPRELLMPMPTNEQVVAINNLGDKKYRVREDAQKFLKSEDLKAYIVVNHGINSPDPEIVCRSKILMQDMLRLPACPPIYFISKLDNSLVLPSGRVIDEEEMKNLHKLSYVYFYTYGGQSNYYKEENKNSAIVATQMMAEFLLKSGYDRKDVLDFMSAMGNSDEYYYHYNAYLSYIKQKEEE